MSSADDTYQENKTDVETLRPTATLETDSDSSEFLAHKLFDIPGNDSLTIKTVLVNEAIDDIGFTNYHVKLFFLNGFGYAVDSLLMLIASLTQTQILREFNYEFPILIATNYVGLFVGAICWGVTADIIGRKIAFNLSLFLTAVFAIATGGGLSLSAVCGLSAVSTLSAGGNLIMDTTVFLEFLPSHKQWMVTLMALWWGIGQTVAALVAWPFMVNFSCPETAEVCLRSENMGWRYTFITLGALVLVLAILRVTVVRLEETPKYCLANGENGRAVEVLNRIANKYGRVNPLTVEDLDKIDRLYPVTKEESDKVINFDRLFIHVKGLFPNKKIAYSTCLNFLSWTMIGLAYPLFNQFLPSYLQSRGAETGDGSMNTTYKNAAIVDSVSIAGPLIAAPLVQNKYLGRRGTMVIGAILTAIFMFAYTSVRNQAQNLGFSCANSICINIYYGTLFAYTPEVMPAQHRATGNGLSVAFNRAMGAIAPVIAYYSDTATAAPVYVMAALFIGLAIVSAMFPFEPRGHSSM
ncbi:hypothetical protein CANCADRAFT_32475 [Tortispora caseinolytica NRRL Y-17796]|uniref:Major facilitator superfamily (MFS) profile domain-containing protein n=1 Tax=Tortispora caseinolytica NRRL Y-17796 TaxID=767744 RepID=A0A1E4TBI9_9ASCO|nr:hypothetical protein CANCADRAFT_32475 [Tortispora caseinolytica NRRL Y-17796]